MVRQTHAYFSAIRRRNAECKRSVAQEGTQQSKTRRVSDKRRHAVS